jgi:hypothetical protein
MLNQEGIMSKLILDLCGGTGSWSHPYTEAGYEVIIVDPLVDGSDVRSFKTPKDVQPL